jgi:hypothetical protein
VNVLDAVVIGGCGLDHWVSLLDEGLYNSRCVDK